MNSVLTALVLLAGLAAIQEVKQPPTAPPTCSVEVSEQRIKEIITPEDKYFILKDQQLDLFIKNSNELYNIGWQRSDIDHIWVIEAVLKSENRGFQAVHLFFIDKSGCIVFYQNTYLSLVELLLQPNPAEIINGKHFHKASFMDWFSPRNNMDAVVKVELVPEGHGSGVLISPRRVLTAKHVTQEGKPEDFRVMLTDGSLANVVKIRELPDVDVAIMILDRPLRLEEYPEISCEVFEPGDKAIAYGFPLHIPPISTPQEFVAYSFDGGEYFNEFTILTAGITTPGMSGGPLFTEDGKIAGLLHGEWVYGGQSLMGGGQDSDINIFSSLAHTDLCSI